MIAPTGPTRTRCRPQPSASWQEAFLEMLPAVRHHAQIALRGLSAEAREDAVAEVVANALVAYRRLAERGKVELAYPRVLVRYGVAQFREGRRVGTPLNVKDVLSPYAQNKKNLSVGRLDRFDQDESQWKEVLVEDRRASPAEVAAWRLDFAAWLAQLAPRTRKVALTLAMGESGKEAARAFRVTEGRISQIRRRLERHWRAFQGEEPDDRRPPAPGGGRPEPAPPGPPPPLRRSGPPADLPGDADAASSAIRRSGFFGWPAGYSQPGDRRVASLLP